MEDFKVDVDWKEFHGNVKEPIPVDAPKTRGKSVDARLFVDADFAGDKGTRRSRKMGSSIGLTHFSMLMMFQPLDTMHRA